GSGCAGRRAHAVGVDRAAMQRSTDDRAGFSGAARGAEATAQAKGAVMGVYARGSKLWIRFRDADGRWRDASTGFSVGQEELAQVMHDATVARIAAATRTVKHAPARSMTVREFAATWIPIRSAASASSTGRPTRGGSGTTCCRRSVISRSPTCGRAI